MSPSAYPDSQFHFWEFVAIVFSDPASLPPVLAFMGASSLLVESGLTMVLRLFIRSDAPVFREVFEDNVSARWPVRLLQIKYSLPWVPAPPQIRDLSAAARILFRVTRIAGTFAVIFFVGALLAAFFGGSSHRR
jgi:hypothetical protein